MSGTFERTRDRIRYIRWRWARNCLDTLGHVLQAPRLESQNAEIVATLRAEGIAVMNRPADPVLFEELQATASRIAGEVWDEDANRPRSNRHDRKGDRTGLGPEERKDFLQVLTPRSFAPDSVYLRYALQPPFIAIANAYLGLKARLRAVHLWLNFPTNGDAASTQLWHRDGDDFMNLKIFTYLTDVGNQNGPFGFIPRTQPLGSRRIRPDGSEHGRTNDEQMRRAVDESNWKICTGSAGSVIYADTCGYHKGVKPVAGRRLMLMVHYSSGAATSGSELKIDGMPKGVLSREQLIAIGAGTKDI
jgi:hypothetical protein